MNWQAHGQVKMEASLGILAAALERDYMSLSGLVSWADRQILGVESPPSWLLDVSLAQTKEDALGLLMTAWHRHVVAEGEAQPLREIRDDLHLGFMFMRFQRGELTMAELLSLAGRLSDCRQCRTPCEEFYLLLNEIDGCGPTRPSDRPLSDRVAELFAPMERTARQYLDLLPTAGD
jgi:hypothetical protein